MHVGLTPRRSPGSPLFNLHLANPLYWLFACGMVMYGALKRWLTANEVTLSAGLLLIPYVLRAQEMGMAGMGRFAAVVFPVYIVMGRLLAKMPPTVAAALLAICGFFLGAYAALFAAWYPFY
jgi:hypothetical protein